MKTQIRNIALTLGLAVLMGNGLLAAFADDLDPIVKFEVTAKDGTLSFSVDELVVSHGQTVELTFINNASPKSGMSHNWVLTAIDKAQEVATQSLAAGPSKGWLQDGPNVLAKTKLLAPGEKDVIRFVAPAVIGKYPFICTFPGHYPVMRGTLIVN